MGRTLNDRLLQDEPRKPCQSALANTVLIPISSNVSARAGPGAQGDPIALLNGLANLAVDHRPRNGHTPSKTETETETKDI